MQTDYIRPSKAQKRQKFPQDYETPFSPPFDISDSVPCDYPTKDTSMDSTEWYQNGGAIASNTEFPNQPRKVRPPLGFVMK